MNINKFKNLAVKIALVGISGIMLGGAMMSTHNTQDVESLKAIQEKVFVINSDVAAVQFNTMIEQGIVSENISTGYSLYSAEGPPLNYASSLQDTCEVNLAFDANGFSPSVSDPQLKGVADSLIKYSEAEKLMTNQFVAAHEYAHCSFSLIKDKFQISGDSEASAVLNKIYNDTGGIKIEDGKVSYGLERLQNEAFADSLAFISMVKESKGAPEVLNFMNKLSAERFISTNLGDKVSENSVDGYDISLATKMLNTPEMVKKIVEADSPEALTTMALENATSVVIHNLAKKSSSEIEASIGVGMLQDQLQKTAGHSRFHSNPNSLTSMGIEQAKGSLDKQDLNTFNSVTNSIEIYNANASGKLSNEAIKDVVTKHTELTEKIREFLPSIEKTQVEPGVKILKNEISKVQDVTKVQQKGIDGTLNQLEDYGLTISTKDIAAARSAFKEVQQNRIEASAKKLSM